MGPSPVGCAIPRTPSFARSIGDKGPVPRHSDLSRTRVQALVCGLRFLGHMTAEAQVRRVHRSDHDAWLSLRARLWPGHPLENLTREVDSFLGGGALWKLGNDSIPFLVMVADHPTQGVVGFLEASLRPWADRCLTAPVGYLEGWYVVPELRRRGIGGALVRSAEDWARAQGCQEMASDAHVENRTSERCHRALGYEEVARLIHFKRALHEDRHENKPPMRAGG